ncbi:16S rRNA (cytosine(1402)-N(4))-methyltransferase RsmH [Candidatus Clavichlamydia salmonicola]|uniref:16S rRNA (cytosine(1402)-N(4))-methyltransferase RsmH n=1 Tax=Candidatus Clavichlamydia salmonicola TaxID=469812 RepID=UPI00189105B7|nr:16S rRNA (cytosine(1402)-N(4))-methyltransferase RsmH [Candidatus Clavichlamydia salmonicola]
MSILPHIPVLKEDFLSFFSSKEVNSFFDGTLGAGGHAKALLEGHSELTDFVGVDQDSAALELAKNNLISFTPYLRLIHNSFNCIADIGKETPFDGILLDLGFSSMQMDQPERGFSFRKDGKLDMRMDTSEGVTAEEVVNTFSERRLGEIFRDYGEEPLWKRAAAAIVSVRKKHRITTTLELGQVLRHIFPTWRLRKNIHPFTLIFQALRIYVNDEIGALQRFLLEAPSYLKPQGRLAIISFHSLEDREVKNAFRRYQIEDLGVILTKKPIQASKEEIKMNARSRSAKMRLFERVI